MAKRLVKAYLDGMMVLIMMDILKMISFTVMVNIVGLTLKSIKETGQMVKWKEKEKCSIQMAKSIRVLNLHLISGYFKSDKKDGQGEMMWPNGDKYIG